MSGIRRQPGAPQIGGSPVTTRGPSKPRCPMHGEPMAFDSGTMVWRCQATACNMVAMPKQDIESGKGKPIVGQGDLELVRVQGKKKEAYLLRAGDNNVMLDITPYITRMEVAGTSGPQRITLLFANVVDLVVEE